MGGHVNMMDDVLISNLPPEYLRSALRALLAQGSATQKPFVEHIRQRLQGEQSPVKDLAQHGLFNKPDEYTPALDRYLTFTRCLICCKLTEETLSRLKLPLNSVVEANATWTENSHLYNKLVEFSGDIVQAMQALKEEAPPRTEHLKHSLDELSTSLDKLREYCEKAEISYPFLRSARQVSDLLDSWYPRYGLGDSPNRLGYLQEELADIQLSPDPRLEFMTLGPFQVPRLFNGFWQLSSSAWGAASASAQDEDLRGLVAAGYTASDMADHYGDAELVYGQFRNSLPPQVKQQVFAATKWCVFRPIGRPVTHAWVLEAVQERCRRLGGRVELLQFHWYDYGAKEYLEILAELVSISKTHPHLVGTIGLCNFDSAHVREACEYLLAKTGTVGLVSNQIQFSVIDSRPLHQMCDVCATYGLKLLTYGSLCGGLLRENLLNLPMPEMYSATGLLTPSERKYLSMIRDWGTWDEFQALLGTLRSIGIKHGATPASVAVRWVLQKPQVGAVIVGTRLGLSQSTHRRLEIFDFRLSDDDMKEIDHVALGGGREKTIALIEKIGDCGNEYRQMH
ncbi:putative aryl-alcohol dehydrogenase [Xylariaceae sp. FL0594]|nr:putative aryl-alcohol dehydrogenase [Xylariaceae sp. FL0594]